MARTVDTANQSAFPRVLLPRRRLRLSFGLTALFGAMTAVAVVAGAAKMPSALGVLFAIDALTFVMGLYFVRVGFSLYRAISWRPSEDRCARAHMGFGFLLVAIAGLTFGAVAIVNR